MLSTQRALLICCALAALLLGGHLIRQGSQSAAVDAERTLRGERPAVSGWGLPLRPMGAGPIQAPAGLPGTGQIGPPGTYPDPALTPGDVFPVTAEEVCTPGYSKRVRNVSDHKKDLVFQRYGTPRVRGRYEVDHFIALELGGSNDISNLWPEPYEPPPGAREKDRVENYLHAQVCKGEMTLAQAQEAIRSDWYAVYQRINEVSSR